jgi:hypothetical protein
VAVVPSPGGIGDTDVIEIREDHPALAGRLCTERASWVAFIESVKAGEFDLDADGLLPPVEDDGMVPA